MQKTRAIYSVKAIKGESPEITKREESGKRLVFNGSLKSQTTH